MWLGSYYFKEEELWAKKKTQEARPLLGRDS
jgi:hypothetical protein